MLHAAGGTQLWVSPNFVNGHARGANDGRRVEGRGRANVVV